MNLILSQRSIAFKILKFINCIHSHKINNLESTLIIISFYFESSNNIFKSEKEQKISLVMLVNHKTLKKNIVLFSKQALVIKIFFSVYFF